MATLTYDFNPDTLGGSIGSAVASLADSQGSGVNLSQATSGSQPILSNTAITGHQTLHSSAVGSKWMATGTFSALPTGSTIFLVVQSIQDESNYQYPFSSNGGGLMNDNAAFWGLNASAPYGYRVQGGTNTYIIRMTVNGSSSQLHVNGTLACQGSMAVLSSITRMGIFTDNPTGNTFGGKGDFARLQVYSVMTNAEALAQEVSLASTYGVILDTSSDVRFSIVTGSLPVSGAAYRIHISANYSSGTPSPILLFCHGSSGSPTELINTTGTGVVQDQFFRRNGIAAAFQLATTYTQTTLMSDIAACKEFMGYLQANYNVKYFVLMGESRGGICSQVVLAQESAALIPGYIGIFPCCDATAWYSASDPTLNPLTIAALNYAGVTGRAKTGHLWALQNRPVLWGLVYLIRV